MVCYLCRHNAQALICLDCQRQMASVDKRCLSCACLLASDLLYCGQCLQKPPPFQRAYTLYRYQGASAYLVQQLKYHNQLSLARFFASKISQILPIIYQETAMPSLFAMPLHRNKVKQRGFNQMVEILRYVRGAPILKQSFCKRVKATAPFTDLSIDKRRAQIKNAFLAQQTCASTHLLLVDDVMTTGASLTALASEIKKKQPHIKRIDTLTIARSG